MIGEGRNERGRRPMLGLEAGSGPNKKPWGSSLNVEVYVSSLSHSLYTIQIFRYRYVSMFKYIYTYLFIYLYMYYISTYVCMYMYVCRCTYR